MIAYYVHHHGLGHLHRAGAIIAQLDDTDVTVLSSLPSPGPPFRDWLQLPRDDTPKPAPDADPTAGDTLHWVPIHHDGLRERMAIVSAWIREHRPTLAVVDVSVEIALLFRLHGVPVVVVGMPGDRSDRPHRLAYDAATRILAPWAAEFARSHWPLQWRQKTWHTGSISRFDDVAAPTDPVHRTDRKVLLLGGSGGDRMTTAPADGGGWTWRTATDLAAADVLQELRTAEVVVTHAGQNSVAEIAAVGVPAVIIPGFRPHDEQLDTAAVLDRAGLAVVLLSTPAGAGWVPVLERARQLGGSGWARWRAGGGAATAARLLAEEFRR